jgi:undecaprenyl-diphosphatase
LLLLTRQWRHAIFAGSTLLFTALANTATKYFFARLRPEVLSDPLTSYSMPSGHASGSFALFLTLAVLAGRGQPPRMRLTWLLVGCLPATAIALSRVYLGAHWPTDVLAGAMLAACVCAASLWLIQRKEPLNALPPKVWWLVLPALVALFGFFVLRHLPHTMLRYAY